MNKNLNKNSKAKYEKTQQLDPKIKSNLLDLDFYLDPHQHVLT